MKKILAFTLLTVLVVSCRKEVFTPTNKKSATISAESSANTTDVQSIIIKNSGNTDSDPTPISIDVKKTVDDKVPPRKDDSGGITDPNSDPSSNSNSKDKKRKQ